MTMKNVVKYCFVLIALNAHFSACELSGRTCQDQQSGLDVCCSDFYEDANGTCIECDIGWTTTRGKSPCVQCTKLTYGRRCAHSCQCATERCHHVYGCDNYTIRLLKAPQVQEIDDETTLFPDISNNASLSPYMPDNDTSLIYTTIHTFKKTPVMIILYSGGGALVVLTLIFLIAAVIRYKLIQFKNTKEPDEHLYDFIRESNVPVQNSYKNNADISIDLPPPDTSLLSYKNNEDIGLDLQPPDTSLMSYKNNVDTPPPDISLLSVIPMDIAEEREYDYVDNDDGYLHPYDGLKVYNVQDHLYNELREQ